MLIRIDGFDGVEPGVRNTQGQWVLTPAEVTVNETLLNAAAVTRPVMNDKRPNDKLGIAAGYAHISKRAQQLDGDYRTFVTPTWPQRSFEALVTALYQYQVRDGWTMQPNFQYIIHPGGGATLPFGPYAGRPLKNAAVLGLRTTPKF